MANYEQLKYLSEHMDNLDTAFFMPAIGNDHLSRQARRTNSSFCKANEGVPGVMDYDDYGFTEPEEERDCWANNKALAELPKAMPYIEQMNTYLQPQDLKSDRYSQSVLRAAAEILEAKLSFDLTKEQADLACEMAATKDFNFFGCKRYEYAVYRVLDYFEHGYDVEHVRMLETLPDENMQNIEFYHRFCKDANLPTNSDMIKLIGTSLEMGIGFGLESAITDKNLSIEDANAVNECVNMIYSAVSDKVLNPKFTVTYTDESGNSDSFETSRFSRFSMDHDVEAIVDLIDTYDLRGKPDVVKNIVSSFINDSTSRDKDGHPYTRVSDYFVDHFSEFDLGPVIENDWSCKSVHGVFTEPELVVTKSILDDSDFAYFDSKREGSAFDIELSEELASKLGVYYDNNFKPMIQYVTYRKDADGECKSPDIRICVGHSEHKIMDAKVADGVVSTFVKEVRDERDFVTLGDSSNMFTKDQCNYFCHIVNDVVSKNYPSFELSDAVIDNIKFREVSDEKTPRQDLVDAEFGDIKTDANKFVEMRFE